MNKKDGKYAEILTEIAEHIYQDNILKTERRSKFEAPDGNKREIDVLVTLKNGEKIAFEVRDRKGNQGVEWIDQIIGKYKGTDYSTIWVCTFGNCYLSKDAIKALKYNNIEWRNIDIYNNENLEKNIPIFSINALKTIDDNIEMTINGKLYKELIIYGKDNKNNDIPISLKNQIINEIKTYLSNNFDSFIGVLNIVVETDIELNNVENNFDTNKLHVIIDLPIIPSIVLDYFSEDYIVKNNDSLSHLLMTQKKSVFVTDDGIVLNLSFLSNLRNSGYVIANPYSLRIKTIPEKYRKTNKMKLIDIDGNAQDILITEVIGYK